MAEKPTPKPTSYCEYVRELPVGNLHRDYHDLEYGLPVKNDTELFELLLLEINQAGLSWDLMLRKREGLRRAYDGFNIDKVAAYTDHDITRLLADTGIIRNQRKIRAAIHNARVIRQLQQEHGSFMQWLDHHHPNTLEEWIRLFKRTFKFTGPEIVNEFLMSAGYLPGAHVPDCPLYAERPVKG